MKLTRRILRTVRKLADGEIVPSGQVNEDLARMLEEAGLVISSSRGSYCYYRAVTPSTFLQTAGSLLGTGDIDAMLALLEQDKVSRAEAVSVTGDSKTRRVRTFFGFLVNSLEPIAATLNGKPFTIAPPEGSFVFVADFKSFRIPGEVTVVGIENAENFRLIARQRSFFERELHDAEPLLFVSRYPQTGDLTAWLESIPNSYVHFGDLDLAGISIFLTEFFPHLGDRSRFLIPSDYAERLTKGSTRRYDEQLPRYALSDVADPRVRPLIDEIHRTHKGYDQEGFISDK